MRYLSISLAFLFLVAAPTFAQCSTLTVAGSVNPGQTVSIAVTGGTPNAITVLVFGDPGTTTLSVGPFGSLTLDVASPFGVLPLGFTDASGDVSVSFAVSSSIPAGVLPDLTLTLQAVNVSFSGAMPPSLSFCTSNTATLVIGAG